MTIREIADIAGVSRGTVDRVLHARGRVREEVEKHVWTVARQCGYVPNRAGQALAMRKDGKKIGAALSVGNNPFFLPIVEGMRDAQREYEDYSISLDVRYLHTHDAKEQVQIIDELVAEKIDALILIPIEDEAVQRKIKSLIQRGLPVVTLNSDCKDSGRLTYVGCDYLQSGRAAGHLMNLLAACVRRICVVVGSRRSICHAERLRGFSEICRSRAGQAPIIDVVESDDNDEVAYARLCEKLSAQPDTDAFYFAAGGVRGGLAAVRDAALPGSKPTIITMDETAAVVEAIRDDFVAATISQEPHRQGYEAVCAAANAVINRSHEVVPDIIVHNNIIMKYNLPSQRAST